MVTSPWYTFAHGDRCFSTTCLVIVQGETKKCTSCLVLKNTLSKQQTCTPPSSWVTILLPFILLIFQCNRMMIHCMHWLCGIGTKAYSDQTHVHILSCLTIFIILNSVSVFPCFYLLEVCYLMHCVQESTIVHSHQKLCSGLCQFISMAIHMAIRVCEEGIGSKIHGKVHLYCQVLAHWEQKPASFRYTCYTHHLQSHHYTKLNSLLIYRCVLVGMNPWQCNSGTVQSLKRRSPMWEA